jgi:hypothetical protein
MFDQKANQDSCHDYLDDQACDARVMRMSATWHGDYHHAGRGVGQYAIASKTRPMPPSRPRTALVGFGGSALGLVSLLALGGFAYGLQDAYARRDGAAAAGEKAFFYVNDFIVDALHELLLKVVSSANLLGFADAMANATGYCLASLVAKCAACGAAVVGAVF